MILFLLFKAKNDIRFETQQCANLIKKVNWHFKQKVEQRTVVLFLESEFCYFLKAGCSFKRHQALIFYSFKSQQSSKISCATRFVEISPILQYSVSLWAISKSLNQYLAKFYIVFGKCYAFGRISIVINAPPILKKIAIWSHWSGQTQMHLRRKTRYVIF